VALVPACAFATEEGWTEDGKLLPTGVKQAFTFETIGGVTMEEPAQEFTFLVGNLSGKGTLVNTAKHGTAMLEPVEGICEWRRDKIEEGPCETIFTRLITVSLPPAGIVPRTEVPFAIKEMVLKLGGATPKTLKGKGVVWANGPLKEENLFGFPATTEKSRLTIAGHAATFATKLQLTLTSEPKAVIGVALK
jgi:hypothetical protein